MEFVELKNVCKKYDKTNKNAVSDFNLSIVYVNRKFGQPLIEN